MTDRPDAAAAIVWNERTNAALSLSRQMLAHANAVADTPDPHGDDLHPDCRRTVYRHLCAAADAYEVYADRCRERAHDAQQLRRSRYEDGAA